jgi:glyoxylase-like metal-dependent hydrolase (beta-lactamase superfamily II)
MSRIAINNCPILEVTGDNRSVGRCWFGLTDEVRRDRLLRKRKTGRKLCPRHGDVTEAVRRYIEYGELTREEL